MTRILLCITALTLVGACKKDSKTDIPDDPGASPVASGGDVDAGATDTPPSVPQEPDPPAIAESRSEYLLGHYDKVKAVLEPLTEDLKTREQLRASGLSAGWLALAVVEPVAEDAHGHADHAVAMAKRTQDKEVEVVAKLAYGAYQMGTEDHSHAAESFEAAYKLEPEGPNAGLALVLYGNAKVNMAFGGEERDKLTNPAELESAGSTFTKALRLVENKPDQAMVAARAHEGLASVAHYKKDSKELCTRVAEADKLYTAANAGSALLDRVHALRDAGSCK